jgi:hypothetical protein
MMCPSEGIIGTLVSYVSLFLTLLMSFSFNNLKCGDSSVAESISMSSLESMEDEEFN